MIRWFFIALVVVVVSLFIGKNMNHEPISIDYVFGETNEMSPLMGMFFAFVTGFLTWFVISLFNFLKMRAEIASKDKLIKNLKEELNDYRNASLSIQDRAEETLVIDTKDGSQKDDSESDINDEEDK